MASTARSSIGAFYDSEDLQSQIRDLKQELHGLRKENTQLGTKVRRAESETLKYTKAYEDLLRSKTSSVGGARLEKVLIQTNLVNGLKQQVSSLESELKLAHEALRMYKKDSRYTRTIELEQETAVYYEEARRLSQLLSEADGLRSALEEDLMVTNNKLEKYRESFKQEKQQRRLLEVALKGRSPGGKNGHHVMFGSAAEEMATLREEAEHHKASVEALQKDLNAALDRETLFVTQVDNARQETATANEDKQEVESELEKMKTALSETEEKLAASEAQSNVLSSKIEELKLSTENQLKTLQRTLDEERQGHGNSLEEHEKALMEVRKKGELAVEQAQKEVDMHAENLRKAREGDAGAFQNMRDELTKITRECQAQTANVAVLEEKNKELEDKLAKTKLFNEDFELEMKKMKALFDTEKAASSSVRSSLTAKENELERRMVEIDTLKGKLNRECDATTELERKVRVLKSENEELQEKLSKNVKMETPPALLAVKLEEDSRYPSPMVERTKTEKLTKNDTNPRRKVSISDASTVTALSAHRYSAKSLGLSKEEEEVADTIVGKLTPSSAAMSLLTEDEAATIIQSRARGVKVRKEMKNKKEEKTVVVPGTQEEEDDFKVEGPAVTAVSLMTDDEAATCIQTRVRGIQGRNHAREKRSLVEQEKERAAKKALEKERKKSALLNQMQKELEQQNPVPEAIVTPPTPEPHQKPPTPTAVMTEDKAAAIIQAHARGHITRKSMHEEAEAAPKPVETLSAEPTVPPEEEEQQVSPQLSPRDKKHHKHKHRSRGSDGKSHRSKSKTAEEGEEGGEGKEKRRHKHHHSSKDPEGKKHRKHKHRDKEKKKEEEEEVRPPSSRTQRRVEREALKASNVEKEVASELDNLADDFDAALDDAFDDL